VAVDWFFATLSRVTRRGRPGPAVANLAIAEIERGRMTGTEQASCRQASEAEVGLFVRAHPFAGHRAVFVPDQDQIDAGDADADDRLCNQPAKPADRHPLLFA